MLCMQTLYESQRNVAEAHFEAIDVEDVGMVSITECLYIRPDVAECGAPIQCPSDVWQQKLDTGFGALAARSFLLTMLLLQNLEQAASPKRLLTLLPPTCILSRLATKSNSDYWFIH